jgi:hypothetical protein
MFGGEVTLVRGKLYFFCLFVFFLIFWVVVEFFLLLLFLHVFCYFISVFFLSFFLFLVLQVFFLHFVCVCVFCKFFVGIYFTIISIFQFAGSLHLVKDLTLHSSLVKKSRSCLKEGKLQKSKVCPLNLSNATSNLGSSKPRFFFQVYGLKRLVTFSTFGQFFVKFTLFYF